MAEGSSSVLNFRTVGILVALYAVYSWVSDYLESRRQKKQRKELEDRERRNRLEVKTWGLAELKAYDGTEPDGPILIAVDGEVYNVWRGREFYGADGAYAGFAGRDATRLLAKYIVTDAEDDGAELGAFELETLNGWKELFRMKYDFCGKLAEGEGKS